MNTLDIIKQAYIKQLTSLNYDSSSKYPNTWNKEEFKLSLENIDTNNKNIIVEQYIDTIINGLNINEIEQNAYQNSLAKLSGLNININELEQVLNQYLMEHPNINILDPYTNPLNDKNFREKLEEIINGYSGNYSYGSLSEIENPINYSSIQRPVILPATQSTQPNIQLKELQQQLNQAHTNYNIQSKEINEIRNKLRDSTTHNKELQQELNNALANIARLNLQIVGLQQQLITIQRQLKTERDLIIIERDEARLALANSEKLKDDISTELKHVKENSAIKDERLVEKDDEILAKNQELEQARQGLEVKDARIRYIDEQLITIQRQLKTQRDLAIVERDEAREALDKAERANANIIANVKNISNELKRGKEYSDIKDARLEEKDNEIRAKNQELEQARQDLEVKDTRIRYIDEQLINIQRQLKTQRDLAIVERDEARKALDKAERANANIIANVKNISSRLDQVTSKLSNVQRISNIKDERLIEKDNEIRAKDKELEQFRQDLLVKDARILVLENELITVQRQLKVARDFAIVERNEAREALAKCIRDKEHIIKNTKDNSTQLKFINDELAQLKQNLLLKDEKLQELERELEANKSNLLRLLKQKEYAESELMRLSSLLDTSGERAKVLTRAALDKLREQGLLLEEANTIIDELVDQVNKDDELNASQKAEYLAELQSYKDQLRQNKGKLVFKGNYISYLERRNKQIKDRLEKVSSELNAILKSAELADKNALDSALEVFEAESRIKELEKIILEERERADSATQDYKTSQGLLEVFTNRLAKIKASKTKVDAQLKELLPKLDLLRQQLDNSVSKEEADRLSANLALAEAEIDRLRQSIASGLEDVKREALANLRAAQADASTAKDSLRDAQATQKLADANIQRLQSDIDTLKLNIPELERLKRELDTEKVAKSDAEAALARAVAAHALVEVASHEANEAIRAELDNLREVSELHGTEFNKNKKDCDELKSRLALALAEAKAARELHARLVEENNKNKDENSRLNGAIRAAEALKEAESLRAERLQILLDSKQQGLTALEQTLNELKPKLKATEDELAELKATLSVVQPRLKATEEELIKVKGDLKAQKALSDLNKVDGAEELARLQAEITNIRDGNDPDLVKKTKCDEQKAVIIGEKDAKAAEIIATKDAELAAKAAEIIATKDAELAAKAAEIIATKDAELADALAKHKVTRDVLITQGNRDVELANKARDDALAALKKCVDTKASDAAASRAATEAAERAAADAARAATEAAERAAADAAERAAAAAAEAAERAAAAASISNLIAEAKSNKKTQIEEAKAQAMIDKKAFKDFLTDVFPGEKDRLLVLKTIITQLQIVLGPNPKFLNFVTNYLTNNYIVVNGNEGNRINDARRFWSEAADDGYIFKYGLKNHEKKRHVFKYPNNVENHSFIEKIITGEYDVDHDFIVDFLLFFIDYINEEADISDEQLIELNQHINDSLQVYPIRIRTYVSEVQKRFINYVISNKNNTGITPSIKITLTHGYYRLNSIIADQVFKGRLNYIFKKIPGKKREENFNDALRQFLKLDDADYNRYTDIDKTDGVLHTPGIDEEEREQIKEDLDFMRSEIIAGRNPIPAQEGGFSSDEKLELLDNFVSAYIMLRSPVYNKSNKIQTIKDIITSSIKSSIKIKDNKIVKIKIPLINDLLKVIFLPLFCETKGIKVTYDNMFKCYTKNIHKLLSSKEISKYLELFNLNKEQKAMLRQYDRRVASIMRLI
jgi:hypothetical protein